MLKVKPKTSNSRNYMMDGIYEVNYYLDYNPKNVSPHFHDFYELYFYLSGNVEYMIGQELYQLKHGDLLFIPPGLVHNPLLDSKKEPYERIVVWIKKETFEGLSRIDKDILSCMEEIQRANYLIRSSEQTIERLYNFFISLYDSYEEKKLCYISEGLNFISNILVLINRILYYEKNVDKVESQPSFIKDILQYIDSHLVEKITLERLEKDFLINKYYISRLMKQNLGISVYQYIIKKRLLLAMEYILSGYKINTVHEICGFTDYSCFYRAFVKEYGMNPKEYLRTYYNKNYLSGLKGNILK